MNPDHKPHDQLLKELEEAGKKITVGSHYSHYKHPDRPYIVKQLAVLEADDEVCVVYGPADDSAITFVRPAKEWLEIVEWQGQSTVRFTKTVG
jgi:hypothetical protein